MSDFLVDASDHARSQRMGESTLGLSASGGLLGVGIAAQGDDMTLSHGLWVASGITAGVSLLHFFVPSDLELLQSEAGQLSEDELRARWKAIAEAAATERVVGGVVSGLVGVGGIVAVAVILEGDDFDLTPDE